MTPKEKAKELVDKFKDKVNPYVGSGMLSNTYDDRTILVQSQRCALIATEEIIEQWDYIDTYLADMGGELNPNLRYWLNVKEEIKKL